MKFIVSTSTLLKTLSNIGGVITTNSVLPILEDFLFEIKGNKLTIFSTDLETSMSSALEIEAKEEGKVAIPAKMLLETLKTLPDQPLTFSIDDQTYAVEITTDNGKYKLAGENGDDFPRIPSAENVNEVEISSGVLADAIGKTLFAVSNDELRPAMTGIYVNLDSEGATFVATDAHKLVRFRRKDVIASEPTNFIVPKKAMNLLNGVLVDDDTSVKIAYDKTSAFFTVGDTNLICRLVDARYPDYNAVIPTDNPNTLTIDKSELHNSLKRIAIYANKTTHQVLLNLKGSEMNISAQDLDFSNEANERLTCAYEGEDLEIGFNAKFLIEMIGVVDTSEVKFELSTPTRAGIILPTETDPNEDVLMLVMPVMLNA